MALPHSQRKYDLILFGAAGYTGKLTAEQVLQHTPSSLRWAIAGRSPHKLELLAADLDRRFPDRVPVGIFIADLDEDALEKMARATRCLISTVGPFIRYGTAVVEACAVNGTHYVDSTGEITWVKEIVDKYHKTAKVNGAIMIPQCGMESAPADLAAHTLVKSMRDSYNCPVGDVTLCLHELKAGMSGGTLESGMSLLEHSTLQEVVHATRTYALSPVRGYDLPFAWPMRRHPELGILTKWIQAVPDTVYVYRSWGTFDRGQYYGENFNFMEYRRANNWISAVFWFLMMCSITVLPIFAPFRWLARKLIQPGEGPTAEQMAKYRIEYRGVAEADDDSETPKKVFVKLTYEKDPYTCTGALMVQVAMSILFDEDIQAKKLGCGILTAATVATPEFYRNLDRTGFHIETKLL
ncbi:hypothetical protein C7212DRAFT_310474 [Tuber magnatum]|uniref:Saccharopine dehydrogenase NADP binding domain-containing protein n=1 Tax=Tuber magnatum TaxID=42249 RepID=A0A317T2A2_9PEZI|nr:hypothetical protein C7212DRAFT_310474 [Tuber magnatum]